MKTQVLHGEYYLLKKIPVSVLTWHVFCPIRGLSDFLPDVNLVGQGCIYPFLFFFFLFVYLPFFKIEFDHGGGLDSYHFMCVTYPKPVNTRFNTGTAHVSETFPDVLRWKPVFSDSTVLYGGKKWGTGWTRTQWCLDSAEWKWSLDKPTRLWKS